jgi:lipopolysaccharide transport system permease protein
MNPMVGIIDGFRYALFGRGTPIYMPGLIVSIVLAALMMVGGLYYFRNTERVFADII